MEGVPVGTMSTTGSGFSASDDFYGHDTLPELSGVSGHAIILSYAPPDMVRQAKLEALELRVRRKMLEHKASLEDPYALSELSISGAASIAVRVSACTDGVGSRDLVKSLVVPPELTEHGEEVCGSSKFILDGERLEYQRPGRVAGHKTVRMPYYRTCEPGQRPNSPTNPKKNPGGIPVGPAADRKDAAGEGSSGTNRTSARERGARNVRDSTSRQGLKAQLSDGMLTYVPSKFERPKGVESTAFVPQGQAMAEARQKYECVKQRRPASAPLRRTSTVAAASRVSDADVSPRSITGSGGAAAATAASTNGRIAADFLISSSAQGGVVPVARDKKWMDVPVVLAEETDLLAMYRQNSRQLLQENGASTSKRTSPKLRGASTRSLSPTAKSAAALQPRHGGDGGSNGRARRVAALNSMPANCIATATATVTVNGPMQKLHNDDAAKARSRPASAGPTAWGPRNPTRVSSKPTPPAPKPSKPPIAPATGVEAAALAAAAGKSSHSAAAYAWEGARPRSPNRSPAASRPTSQRQLNVSTGPGPAAGTSRRQLNVSIGPAAGPSQRQLYMPAGATSGTGLIANKSYSSDVAVLGNSSTRMGLQPVDPETRRQRQTRPGSAITTAKTNRLRVVGVSSSHTSASGGVAVDSGRVQPAWTSSSDTAPAPCDRTQLQERILGGLLRQITLGADDDEADESSTPTGTSGGGAADSGGTHWRRGRQRTASDTAGFGGGVGLLAHRNAVTGLVDQRQQYQPPSPSSHPMSRPHSAPNRRLRPPSPGHWAGRPEADSPLGWTSAGLQHTTTGIVYDPEVQPSPLDSYVKQLIGVD